MQLEHWCEMWALYFSINSTFQCSKCTLIVIITMFGKGTQLAPEESNKTSDYCKICATTST